MKHVTIIDHPLFKRDLTIIRDRKTNSHLFRTTLRRISSIMAFTVTHDLRLKKTYVQTPSNGRQAMFSVKTLWSCRYCGRGWA